MVIWVGDINNLKCQYFVFISYLLSIEALWVGGIRYMLERSAGYFTGQRLICRAMSHICLLMKVESRLSATFGRHKSKPP
jgi:hypothetical protein